MSARRADPAAGYWTGPTRHYDILKEGVIALVVVALLAVGLSWLFASPDTPAVTLQQWAKNASGDFVATATAELGGTSTSAGYGPPYNHASDGQHIGPLYLAKWAGVRIPVDSADDFVIAPLQTLPQTGELKASLDTWAKASSDDQTKWTDAYTKALTDAGKGDPTAADPTTVAADPSFGPVPVLTGDLEAMAVNGQLDGVIQHAGAVMYNDDYTKPLLFLADGSYLAGLAGDQHLSGDNYGVMNETGSWPGQSWLWLFGFWYQIKPFTNADSTWGQNADAIIWAIMIVLSVLLILVPFIPGLRSIPRWIPVHRLIWRNWYRRYPPRQE